MREIYVLGNHIIPEMEHPLSSAWDQPSTKDILIGDKHAMMGKKAFDELHEYSTSFPTGVYEGKMWKRNDLIPNPNGGPGSFLKTDKWYLVWYGTGKNPERCSVNYREIILPEV